MNIATEILKDRKLSSSIGWEFIRINPEKKDQYL